MSVLNVSEKRAKEWRSATRRGLRFFGLSGKPGARAMGLAAVLIVAGAALMAIHGIPVAIGAGLWLVGAVIAIRGWLRVMRDHARADRDTDEP